MLQPKREPKLKKPRTAAEIANLDISHSQNETARFCLHKWYKRYVLRETLPPTKSLTFGSQVHALMARCLEDWHDDTTNLVASNMHHVNWSNQIDSGLAEKMAVAGLDALKADMHEILFIEEKLSHDGFTCIIDLVYIDKSGYVVVADWKTASKNYPKNLSQTKGSNQLKAYAHMTKVVLGRSVRYKAHYVLNKATQRCQVQKVISNRKENQLVFDMILDGKEELYNRTATYEENPSFLLDVFPKNKPDSCYAYGKVCHYYDDCHPIAAEL